MKKFLFCLLIAIPSIPMERKGSDIILHLDELKKQKQEDVIDESTDSNKSNGRHSNLRLALISSITGLTSAAITAAVTLAVHFSTLNNNCPTKTP